MAEIEIVYRFGPGPGPNRVTDPNVISPQGDDVSRFGQIRSALAEVAKAEGWDRGFAFNSDEGVQLFVLSTPDVSLDEAIESALLVRRHLESKGLLEGATLEAEAQGERRQVYSAEG